MSIKQFKYLSEFQCIGAKCPDNCCYGWKVDVDPATVTLYEKEAPELFEFIDKDGEECSMKKHEGSPDCIMLDDGWCKIHKNYGADYLSRICTTYPRLVKKVGDVKLMSGEVSCPELMRICLYGEDPFQIINGGELPRESHWHNYLPEGETEDRFLKVHRKFIDFCNNTKISAGDTMYHIVLSTKGLMGVEQPSWSDFINFFLHTDDTTEAEKSDEDPFRLLQIVCNMLNESSRSKRKRLEKALENVMTVLNLQTNAETWEVTLSADSKERFKKLHAKWMKDYHHKVEGVFKRYIQAEISGNIFPYGGQGTTMYESACILAMKFGLIRLALMCDIETVEDPLSQDNVVKNVQGLSRYLNHTREVKLVMPSFEEFGWIENAKLKGMLECI